jgi:hypothetical protein
MDHGDHAQIGDLVELIGPAGQYLGIAKLVLGVQNKRTLLGDTERYLYLEGELGKVRACYARIIRRAMRK